MPQSVDVGVISPDMYEGVLPAEINKLREVAEELKGARVLHINATPYGGGVSELLRSTIPLERALGIDAQWEVITGEETFFRVTKSIHNALQGAEYNLSRADQETYLAYNSLNARSLSKDYDFIIVHDPQPAVLRHLRQDIDARWIWRCHIDTSKPNPQVWNFLVPFINEYDAVVFTLDKFIPAGLTARVDTILPAIDPLSPKNMELPEYISQQLLNWIGVPKDGPLICQVSRFDPWKDPLGVMEAYKLVKQEKPDTRLVLIGSMALDDPEGWDMYQQIVEESRKDEHIHVFTNLVGVGALHVNAFQRLADVVIQKSIKEGFGLVVSETLWKGTPVVAGRAGGIPVQMEGGGGFLVDSVNETAERVLELLDNPDLAIEEGRRGKEHVFKRFLITRLIQDELSLLSAMGNKAPSS